MRLRVQVLRHGFPAIKVLWTVPSETTAASLLQQIDDVFPLEAEGWGFEDYALLNNGYEVLHWMQLDQLLKDDDAVSYVDGPWSSSGFLLTFRQNHSSSDRSPSSQENQWKTPDHQRWQAPG